MRDKIKELPEDVWYEVLIKAPAEDVAKYRHLSKFHRNLIDSPEFIQKQNDVWIKSRAAKSHVIISGWVCNDKIDYRVDFRGSNTFHVHKLIAPAVSTSINKWELKGSCMGILCYKFSSPTTNGIILWNPLTGFSRTIPLKPTQLDDELRYYDYILGHDDVTDDIKVLKMHVPSYICIVGCEMYSSKTDSWTQLNMKEYADGIRFCRPVFVSSINSMCWSYENGLVLAYNLSTQKFNKFPWPKTAKSSAGLYISSFDGCLCVNMLSSEEGCLEVWKMNDEGSWDPLVSVPNVKFHDAGLKPLVFQNNGGQWQLVISWPKKGLLLYHLETAYVEKLELQLKMPEAFVFTPTIRKP